MSQLALLAPHMLVPVGPAVDHGYTGTWGVGCTNPSDFTADCQPTILSKDMRCDHWNYRDGPCECVGDLMYRGACLGEDCGWVSAMMRVSEHMAICDALDHSWDTWRYLPVDPGPIPEGNSPADAKKIAAWIARLVSIGYPEGWIEAGGPIRVRRQQMGTRPHVVHTGFGNYSVTGEVMGCSLMGCDGLPWCQSKREVCTPFNVDGEDED